MRTGPPFRPRKFTASGVVFEEWRLGNLCSMSLNGMKSAVLRDDEGFDILINGVFHTFRDVRESAYAAARYLKSRALKELVEVVDRSTGQKVSILEDGRMA
jgi:hypothetical protein